MSRLPTSVAGILWLDEIGEDDRPRVGGKAWSLARLRRAGLPVPDGFVLTATSPELDAVRAEALGLAYSRLGGTVAVRSSGTAEDLAEASFAGQYRTLLDVRGQAAVLDAARACLASAAAGRAYAEALAAPASGAMAVLVQRFVEPSAAGVAFTRAPDDEQAVLIEAHAGRGSELVSGRVRPQRYLLDRATGALREAPAARALDVAALEQVARLAQQAEQLLGAPQDVEWALGQDGPLLLQSRPITVEPEDPLDPSVTRLTRANVGEVLPDPVTPLTWTTVGAALEHAFRSIADAAGLLPDAKSPPFLVLHRQRLYLNLSLCQDVACRLPGVSADDAERLVLGGGVSTVRPALPDSLRGPTALFRLLRAIVGIAGLERDLPRRTREAERLLRGLPEPERLATAEPSELRDQLAAFARAARELGTLHVATSASSAVRLALLRRFVERGGSTDPVGQVNRLVSGLDSVESAEPALALDALNEEAAGRPEWLAFFSRDPAEAARRLRDSQAPPELAVRLAVFLRRFGHRGVSEGELRARTWEDDPTPVLAALRAAQAAPGAAGFGRAHRREARRADEEAVLSARGLLTRALLARLLHGAQHWVRQREHSKGLTVALVRHGRRLARRAGVLLAAERRLGSEDDVFFLTNDELLAALEGVRVSAARVARRRRRFEREGALAAPREVDLTGAAASPVPGEAESLNGLGVSPGVGRGRARVVRPGEAARLEPGEVLVAPVLDAALGPLLASSGAAVAEIGGMLSHGAVVARELGVPCVVDVRDATQRIRTGESLLVDGSAGRVFRGGETAARMQRAGGPPPALLTPVEAIESLHALEDHALARESVYFNVQTAEGLVMVGSAGLRPGRRGEALLALALPDGRLLFGLDLARARLLPDGLAVGGLTVRFSPFRIAFEGRLAAHEAAGFPPGPLPLLLAPRTVTTSLELQLVPTTPAIDLCEALSESERIVLACLGSHHLEQSGRWRGALRVEGQAISVAGSGSRDHTWGRRDWNAADHWRLFTARLDDELAVHALAVSARGTLVEGGFLWRDGRAERILRVRYAGRREGDQLASFALEVTTAADGPLRLRGVIRRTVRVPVQIERRPLRHVAGHPYRLILNESFARYEAAGQSGFGMAEFTERPL